MDACFAAVNASRSGPYNHSFTFNDDTVESSYRRYFSPVFWGGVLCFVVFLFFLGGGCWAATSMTGQVSGPGPGFPLNLPAPEVAGVQLWAKIAMLSSTAATSSTFPSISLKERNCQRCRSVRGGDVGDDRVGCLDGRGHASGGRRQLEHRPGISAFPPFFGGLDVAEPTRWRTPAFGI